MDFDFHTSFAGKTNVELLQIVLQKDLYQAGSVVVFYVIYAISDINVGYYLSSAFAMP